MPGDKEKSIKPGPTTSGKAGPARPPTGRVPPKPEKARPPARPWSEPASRRGVPPVSAGPAMVLSLEAVLYLLLIGVALALRVYQISQRPLQTSELAVAWAAWSALNGEAAGLGPSTAAGGVTASPLLVWFGRLAFTLFGPDDGGVRLLPALAGAALVGIPWFLRKELGRGVALIAAALFALGPTLLYFSRFADGAIVAAAGGLALLACAVRYRETKRPGPLFAGAAVLAVILPAGPATYTALLPLILYGVITLRPWATLDRVKPLFAQPPAIWRKAGLIFLALFVALTTSFLTDLSGIQAGLIDPLDAWLAAFLPQTESTPGAYILDLLVLYETLTLAVAFPVISRWAGEVIAARVSVNAVERSWTSPLIPVGVTWAVLGLLIALLSHPHTPATLVVPMVPLTLLAAQGIGRFLASLKWQDAPAVVGLAAALLLVYYAVFGLANLVPLFGGRFASLERQIQTVEMMIGVGLLILLLIFIAYLVRQAGLTGLLQSVGLLLLVILAVNMVHQADQVAFYRANSPNEPMVLAPTSEDVKILAADLKDLSRLSGTEGMAIQADARYRLPLAWYLRDFRDVRFSGQVGTKPEAPVVIAPADQEKTLKTALKGYGSDRYQLRATWTSPQSAIAEWLTWLVKRFQPAAEGQPPAESALAQWLLRREGLGTVKTEEMIVFAGRQ